MDGVRDTAIDKQKIKIPYSFSHTANIDHLFYARHCYMYWAKQSASSRLLIT